VNGKVCDMTVLFQQKKKKKRKKKKKTHTLNMMPGGPQSQFGCSVGEKYLTLPRNKSLFPVHPADILILIKA
jgi:hypothetical protein